MEEPVLQVTLESRRICATNHDHLLLLAKLAERLRSKQISQCGDEKCGVLMHREDADTHRIAQIAVKHSLNPGGSKCVLQYMSVMAVSKDLELHIEALVESLLIGAVLLDIGLIFGCMSH